MLGSTLFGYRNDSEGIFSLAKKASHPINCAYIGGVFWLHLFFKKGGNRVSPASPDKLQFISLSNQLVRDIERDSFDQIGEAVIIGNLHTHGFNMNISQGGVIV